MAEIKLHNEKNKEDNLSASARGGTLAFILQISALALGFINTIILARILGAEGLGVVMLAFSILSIAAQLSSFGMDGAMMRFVPSYLEKNESAKLKGVIFFSVKFCLLLSLFVGLVILFSSKFISNNIFHTDDLLKLIPFIVFAIPANVINVMIGGILKGYKDTFRALLPQLFISPALKIIIFLLFILDSAVPLYAVAALLLSEIIAMCFSLKFLFGKLGSAKQIYIKTESRKVLGVAFTMMFTGFSAFLFTNSDLWIIGMLMPKADVGIYGVVSKLVVLISFSLGIFAAVIPPIISSVHSSGDRGEMRKIVSESTRWILSMSVPIVLVLTVEGKLILAIYGKDFVNGFSSMVILAVGQLINAGSGLVGYLLLMTGEHKAYMKITLFWGCVNLILTILLVRYAGIVGAALSSAFCLAMVNIVSAYIIYRKLSILTLARGVRFDIVFLTAVAVIYYLISIMDYNMGYHLLLVAALTVYIVKSIIKGDLPLHYLKIKHLKMT